MTCEEARKHFAEAWRGELGRPMEAEFQAHLDSCEVCGREVEELREVWDALEMVPQPIPDARLRTDFYSSLREWQRRESERRRPLWWMRHPAFQSAAAVILLVAGIGIGRIAPGHEEPKFADLQKEVNDMRQLVTLSLLQQQSASDRLRGVNWAYRVEQSDGEVLSALVHTLNSDPNENVRLAAVDALRNFSGSPDARAGLAQALGRQKSPLVQIAILDQLVELRERSSLQSVDLLLREPELNPEVKQRAEWAVRRLQ